MAAVMKLTAGAFQHEGVIPARHTCDGEDVSPALQWSEPPPGTQQLALICDDPDAPLGVWVHWLVYNIPATARSFPENVPKDRELADGMLQGRNDFGRFGYGGPCPPRGPAHRYQFKLYALDAPVGLPSGVTKKDLEEAMLGHVLGEAHLMARYGR